MAGTICSNARAYVEGMGDLLGRVDCEAIDTLAEWLFETWRHDRQALVFGNGGSAYTASHYVADLVKTAEVEGQHRLRALSLVDNFGMTTALGNDAGYDQTLSHPLASYGRAGDLAIAISCSGNSPNVVHACQQAKDSGLRLACLTGFAGGRIAELADLHVNIPSENYGLIEDLHLSIGHMVSQSLKSRIVESQGVKV